MIYKLLKDLPGGIKAGVKSELGYWEGKGQYLSFLQSSGKMLHIFEPFDPEWFEEVDEIECDDMVYSLHYGFGTVEEIQNNNIIIVDEDVWRDTIDNCHKVSDDVDLVIHIENNVIAALYSKHKNIKYLICNEDNMRRNKDIFSIHEADGLF